MRHQAVLLLGPTGSGKSPLGALWESAGAGGSRRLHFDFGAELRREACQGLRLAASELETVRKALRTGALLEDRDLPIALKILDAFLRDRAASREDWLILNGLPRHAGQASAMERRVRMRAVVRLAAGPAVIRARLAADPGGDRAGRPDDGEEAVAARLRLYEERTRPLEDFYRERGVPVIGLDVGPATTAGELVELLRPRMAAVLGPSAPPL